MLRSSRIVEWLGRRVHESEGRLAVLGILEVVVFRWKRQPRDLPNQLRVFHDQESHERLGVGTSRRSEDAWLCGTGFRRDVRFVEGGTRERQAIQLGTTSRVLALSLALLRREGEDATRDPFHWPRSSRAFKAPAVISRQLSQTTSLPELRSREE